MREINKRTRMKKTKIFLIIINGTTRGVSVGKSLLILSGKCCRLCVSKMRNSLLQLSFRPSYATKTKRSPKKIWGETFFFIRKSRLHAPPWLTSSKTNEKNSLYTFYFYRYVFAGLVTANWQCRLFRISEIWYMPCWFDEDFFVFFLT